MNGNTSKIMVYLKDLELARKDCLYSMNLLLISIVILICVLLNRISAKFGIPMLLAFIALGMLFGSDGLFKISFDSFDFAEEICSTALIFIIFYGGFGTKWSEARPVAIKAIFLSTLGVFLTAGLVGLFCYFVLHIQFLESLLIGSVVSSTDAASVFSLLRSKRLNLKYNTASLLEVESGSNDPCAYTLTLIVLSVMNGTMTGGQIAYMIFAQIAYGTGFGLLIAFLSLQFLRKFKFVTQGFDAAFVLGIAMLAYAVPVAIGGNGYLSAYIAGIVLGNKRITNKKSLIHFFDGITGLMQMLIFFLLGLLAFPYQMVSLLLPAFAIALFLTFVARPIAVFAILTPFKCSLNQQLLVSWAGLRGAASIVFAIIALLNPAYIKNDVFHIVFCIVLFSITLQGTLLPFLSKKLDMIDNNENVLKTFTDYSEEVPIQYIKLTITETHPWVDQYIQDISFPPGTLLVLILRGKVEIIPSGETEILNGDKLILSAPALDDDVNISLAEFTIKKNSPLKGKQISQLKYGSNRLIIMIKREGSVVIPDGKTVLKENDVLVVNGMEDFL